jgi:hypothetical protein
MTYSPWDFSQGPLPEIDARLLLQRLIAITCWTIAIIVTAGRLAHIGFEFSRPHLASILVRLARLLQPAPEPALAPIPVHASPIEGPTTTTKSKPRRTRRSQ